MKRFMQLVVVMSLATLGYTAQAQSSLKQIDKAAGQTHLTTTSQVTAALQAEGKRVSINMNNSQDKICAVKIKNAAGIPHQSYTSKTGKQSLEMDLRVLPKGKYLLAITTKNKKNITYEFSKQ